MCQVKGAAITDQIVNRLHAAYDNLPGIFLFRADGTEELVFANCEALALYQCTSCTELRTKLGTTFSQFVLPEDYLPLQELASRSAKSDVTLRIYSYEYRTALGHLRRMEITLHAGEDPDLGSLYYMTLSGPDTYRQSYEIDSMTGLPGMHAFFRSAIEHAKNNIEHGVFISESPVYFNITNFRLLNTVYGIEKGDECLRMVAAILEKNFPGRLIGRLSADNFALLADSRDVRERITEASQEFARYICNPGIELKAGIRLYDKVEKVTFSNGFDEAKLACDTVKNDANHCWAVYREQMGNLYTIRHYIREHFTEALQKKCIKVYFQPVIRTLSGRLCGAEALARWDSPAHGYLSPGDFIPVLEEARLIHQLDAYVIDQVCRQLRRVIDDGRSCIPVSVNLSRLDFLLTDPLRVVEDIRQKYDLPRDMLRIEITENALVQDAELIRGGINRFRDCGYQVWLDDFGSGYSSLNVLKDYHFDVIKLDMNFLRPFNAASRKMLAAIIPMVKDIETHALAEGIETAEQVKFLQAVGCEMIQGYYYGKPMSWEELSQYCREHDLLTETSEEAYLMAQAGRIDISVDAPVAIVYQSGAETRILQMNDSYARMLRTVHIDSIEEANMNINSGGYLREKFEKLSRRAIDNNHTESIVYVERGQYIRLFLKHIARIGSQHVYRAELYNITHERETQNNDIQRFDQALRSILRLYEGIYYINFKKDICEVISSVLFNGRSGVCRQGVEELRQKFTANYIHPDDRERYLQFTAPDTLASRAEYDSLAAPFRVLYPDGSYRWLNFQFIIFRKATTYPVMLCISRNILDQQPDRVALFSEIMASYGLRSCAPAEEDSEIKLLWSTLLSQADLKLFWKDRSGRFLGASQAFLRYYGIKSTDELIGRTDQEMGWHIDDAPFHADEEIVIGQGQTIRGRLGSCLVRGIPHAIRASKFPVYQNGRIVGLMGYFEDLDDAAAQTDLEHSLGLIDQQTQLMNYRGMLMTGMQYQANYRNNHEDYIAAILDVPAYDQLHRSDSSRSDRMLQRLQHIITDHLPRSWSIAHIGSSCFIAFHKILSEAECHQRLMAIDSAIRDIHEADGYPCSLKLHYAMARGSEVHSIDSLLTLLTERLKHAEEQMYSRAFYTGDRIVFDREAFDTMQDSVIIIDPETRDLLYCNAAAQQNFGLDSENGYQGGKCYEICRQQHVPCDDCSMPQLSSGRFRQVLIHNPLNGHDYFTRSTLIPWRGSSSRITILLDMTDYLGRSTAQNDMIYRTTALNDALRLSMGEPDPAIGIQRMLASIGSRFEVQRAMLFEEDGECVRLSYDWAAPGVLPLSDTLAPIPRTELTHLYEKFVHNNIITISDTDSYWAHTPGGVPHLANMQRITAARITLDGHAYGYLELVNPPEHLLNNSAMLLGTVSRFVAILLRNRDMQENLRRISHIDQLTGAMNRRGLIEYLPTLPAGQRYLLIFADVNGLKQTNDTSGHEAGDHLIRQTVAVLRQGDGAVVFRMGGDEFLLLRRIEPEQDIAGICHSIKHQLHEQGISAALGAITLDTPIDDIDTAVAQVDKLMYEDKMSHYRKGQRH